MGRMGFCDSDDDDGCSDEGGTGDGEFGAGEFGDGELRARASTVPCAQLEAVWQVMRDGLWYSLEEIAVLAECAPASASARLRDLRKEKFGGWTVERDYAGGKQWRYRVREKADAAGRAAPRSQSASFLAGMPPASTASAGSASSAVAAAKAAVAADVPAESAQTASVAANDGSEAADAVAAALAGAMRVAR